MPDLYYRRNLPHYQPAEATFFVTFRLAGSIPVDKLRRMKENYALLKRNILSKHDLSDKERKELIYLEAVLKPIFTHKKYSKQYV